MNFSRKTILVVGAALLAACGDKVTVQEYTPPAATAKVNSVEVSPATATLNIGQTITMTAAVNADAGLATTVTWSSSDATKASVSTAGVVTAVAATPGVAICATSTVDTGKKGCATVVVSAATAVIPASVSIASITTGNFNVPVNPAAVANQIDVTLNVNPGNQTISKVELLFDAAVVGTQTFTAAQAAALRYAADEAVAAQTTFPQVVFSINTAAFSAAGVPSWYNGNHAISARVTTTGNATPTASVSQNLTFANANTYVLNTTFSGTPVTGANSYKYQTGSITATVIPVIYTQGLTLASGTLTFGAAGCDAFGPRSIALASNVATFTKSNTAGPAAGNFRRYEFRTATPACPLATGEGFTLTAVDNAGNGLFAAAAPANNAANLFRVDNVPPGAFAAGPTLTQNPGARQNGWVNAAIGFNTTTVASAANGMFVDPAADLGVGGMVRVTRIAAATGGLVDAAIAATASTTPALPAPSTSPTDYCLVVSAKDDLGNETTLPAAGTVCSAPAVASNTALAATHTRFGVDIAPPTIAFSGGLGSNGRISAAAVGGEFQVTVLDTGTVGNAGMLSGSSVMGTVIIRNATVASPVCFIGAVVSGVCTAVSVNAAPAFPLVPTTTVAASATPGYYTYVGYAQDAAGNASGTVTRVTAFDLPANVPTLSTAVFTAPLSSGSVSFTATAADNLDLRDVTYNLTYAGGLAGPIVYPTITLGTYNGTPLVNTAVPAGITIANFVRQVEDVTGNNPITVSGAYKPNNLQGNLRDVVNNASGAVNTAIGAAQVTTGTSYLLAAAPQLVNTWTISNAAASVSDGAPVAPAVAANPTSITLNADAFGPTATFNAPFARVDFYVLFGGQLVQIGTTTSYVTQDNGAAFGRRHRYSITWTPGTTFGLGVRNVYAIGVNSAGDGLVTLASANITITNP